MLITSELFIYGDIHTNWFAASQEIPCILWNSKVNYLIHKCPPPVPILRHINGDIHYITNPNCKSAFIKSGTIA
jgi:hypothetical protein